MGINLASSYAKMLDERFLQMSKSALLSDSAKPKHSALSQWVPIKYSSLRGWYFMNYTLLAIMLGLPTSLILWAIS